MDNPAIFISWASFRPQLPFLLSGSELERRGAGGETRPIHNRPFFLWESRRKETTSGTGFHFLVPIAAIAASGFFSSRPWRRLPASGPGAWRGWRSSRRSAPTARRLGRKSQARGRGWGVGVGGGWGGLGGGSGLGVGFSKWARWICAVLQFGGLQAAFWKTLFGAENQFGLCWALGQECLCGVDMYIGPSTARSVSDAKGRSSAGQVAIHIRESRNQATRGSACKLLAMDRFWRRASPELHRF